MNYRFDEFELDSARFELRKRGERLGVEPQVLSLLLLLVANADRFISKDEIVEKIWNNRIVSDAAISARVKSARRAIGDDGKQQRLLRTIHGKGFRFVGHVEYAAEVPAALSDKFGANNPPATTMPQRPGVAVLPFRLVGPAGANAFLADALADELISDLARLHWLFVIARGSSFRFREALVDCRDIGKFLGVGYCVTGSLTFAGDRVTAAVELVDTASGGVIWADTLTEAVGQLHELQREIAARVVAPLELQIQLHEAQSARLQAPEKMTAWSSYHAGLDHMFRFNRADNHRALELFEHAAQLAPQFARAHAGLSFTRFQNAFLSYRPDRAAETEAARICAERALQLDRMDPFCQLNMGRAFWLHGDLQESVAWFDQASASSPSYAQAIYSRAWARTLSGDAENGESDARLALSLSPLDPLRYAMIATRALSQVSMGDLEEASVLAERAALTPGAHKYIAVIAAITAQLAGRGDKAARWVASVKRIEAEGTAVGFLASFPFAPGATREKIERALRDLGF